VVHMTRERSVGQAHAPRPPRILVVEDDEAFAEVLEQFLADRGMHVDRVATGEDAVMLLTSTRPDLILLDLALPGIDGSDVLRVIRRFGSTPTIVVTARGEERDRIRGFDLGADDYVVKPVALVELAARVKAVLRRTAGRRDADGGSELVRHGLRLRPDRRILSIGGREVELTAKETALLAFLMARPGRVFTRRELLRDVWGYEEGSAATVTVHIHRLREKIEPDPSAPLLLKTVWGVGYRFG
jgi:two-component system response regulator ResD